MHIVQLFSVLSARSKVSKRACRLRVTARRISEFSVPEDTKEGIYGNTSAFIPADYFLPFGRPSFTVRIHGVYKYTHIYIYMGCYINILVPAFVVQSMRACILCDKSASSLCRSAVTRFAPVGMRESCRLRKVVGGKV